MKNIWYYTQPIDNQLFNIIWASTNRSAIVTGHNTFLYEGKIRPQKTLILEDISTRIYGYAPALPPYKLNSRLSKELLNLLKETSTIITENALDWAHYNDSIESLFSQSDFIETLLRHNYDTIKITKDQTNLLGVINSAIIATENLYLTEDTRAQLLSKSRNADTYKDTKFGRNRFERKKLSKIATQVKSYSDLNMDQFFKQDLLEINVPVIGETNNYTVTIALTGVVEEIAKNIRNNNDILEFKTIFQALTKVFNSGQVKVRCTCPDFKFSYAHNLILNRNSVDGTDKDPGAGKTGKVANMTGQGCKHILLVLSNQDFLIKVASVIHNYIFYIESHMQQAFTKIIFPKLYRIPISAAPEENLVPEDTKLDTEKHLIEIINDWAKNRGKFKKGSNINPAYGQGKMVTKQPQQNQQNQIQSELTMTKADLGTTK